MPPIPLPVILRTNALLPKTHPLVCVFSGATTGIGEHTVRALCKHHSTTGLGLRIYLIGRNASAAEKIFADCQKICPNGQFFFVNGDDMALLKNAKEACEKVIEMEKEEAGKRGEVARVDLLVMGQGTTNFNGRQETTEGLDTIMSLFYYSRMRMLLTLLPLLLSSPSPAHIISILGPGNGPNWGRDKIWLDDISLRNPKNYGFLNLGHEIAYMKTFFFEDLAKKHAGKLSLTHYFPGLVFTPAFEQPGIPFWLRASLAVAKPFLKVSSKVVSMEDAGERALFIASSRYPARKEDGTDRAIEKGNEIGIARASDGVIGGGAYRAMFTGEEIPNAKEYEQVKKEGLPKILIDHTMKALGEIEAGRVFKD